MESKGRLRSASIEYDTRKMVLTFEVDNCTSEEVNKLHEDGDLRITAKKWAKKRSLSANALFHAVVSEIADKATWSKARAKNEMITRYGQKWLLDNGMPACVKTNISIEQAWELEEPHLKFVKEENGGNFFILFRGSHTYNSYEMSKLIDGTIEDAKELGIVPPPSGDIKRALERLANEENSR